MTITTPHRPSDKCGNDGHAFNSIASGSATIDCSCTACPIDGLNLCSTINKAINAQTENLAKAPITKPIEHTVPARRLVSHPKEWSEYALVICRGWAASSITLANGGRQILSFLLPGGIVSTATFFGAISGRTVEAITEVSFRQFRRDDIKTLLRIDPAFFGRVSTILIQEHKHVENLAVDLGRRKADARIARLIMYLIEATSKCNMMMGPTMPFPLRRQHIADATGLTPNHVIKTLAEFQQEGLIEIGNRSLTILNASGLRRVADWKD